MKHADAIARRDSSQLTPRLFRPSWSFRRVVTVVAAANLLVAIALFLLRSPAGELSNHPSSFSPLPSQVYLLVDRIAEGHPGESFTLDLSDDDLTATADHYLARFSEVPFTR